MTAILEVLNNGLVQSMLLGPIMGVVFAAIFSGSTNSPPAQTTRTVIHTREVYVTKIVERRGTSRSNEDPMGLLVVLGLALLFVLWKYAIYVQQIQYWVAVALLFALAFGFAALAISFIKGQFTSEEWWGYLTPPMIYLAACLYLLNVGVESFDPRITEVALQNNLWTFYTKALTGYGRSLMLAHVFGMVVLCLVLLLSFFALLHYLALMSQRSYGWTAEAWFFVARATQRFATTPALVVIALLIVISYVGLEPSAAATWFSQGDR
jgi:hypothetical protein